MKADSETEHHLGLGQVEAEVFLICGLGGAGSRGLPDLWSDSFLLNGPQRGGGALTRTEPRDDLLDRDVLTGERGLLCFDTVFQLIITRV